MTKYNGTAITYDAMGNPLSYRDSMRFTWENGRRLSCINSSSGNIAFRYNADGMRVQKENENYITNYYYDSSNNLTGLCIGGSTLFFYYDEKGSITAFSNNDIMYYYVKNMQGDIVKVVKEDGTVAANYVYDAWGKVLSVTNGSGTEISSSNTFHVANLNPFRYRGYMYDNETGLYYLQTRYYDPITGRFLNADDTQYVKSEVLSANLYTYCLNNPVKYIDYNGKSATAVFMFAFSIGVGVAFLIDYAIGDEIDQFLNEYPMSIRFYLHSIFNREYNKLYNFSDNEEYIQKIKSSKTYKKFLNDFNIKEKLDKMIHQSESYFTYGSYSLDFYENNDHKDLQLSIGVCKAKVRIVKLSGPTGGPIMKTRLYSITVTLYDTYDFEWWDVSKDSTDFTKYINNILGFHPQELGAVVPYRWAINIGYMYYSYVCPHGY